MRASFRVSLTAFAASAFVMASLAGAAAQAGNPPPAPPPMASSTPWMQHWAADHEALLDAKLGGLKAGLKLTPDQEKLWGPFEAAVRDLAEMHMHHMMDRMEMMRGMMGQGMMEQGMGPGMGEDEEGGPASPVDRLEAMADRMSEAAAALKKVADTAKPLYASLDDTQKRLFGMLSRDMMMLGHGHGFGMMGGHHRAGVLVMDMARVRTRRNSLVKRYPSSVPAGPGKPPF